MDNYINSDLIRGNIDTIILRSLVESDKYGYEILKEIEAKTQGEYILKQPTLYSCLKRLESQGYITSFWGQITLGGRRKYYKLTQKGKEYFEKVQADWEYSRTLIDKLIAKRKTNSHDSEQYIKLEEPSISSKQSNVNNSNEDSLINSSLASNNYNQQEGNIIEKAFSNINNSQQVIQQEINVNLEETLEKKEGDSLMQRFILDTNNSKEDTAPKIENKSNETENPDKVPIYVPIKGSPIYAKSDKALSDDINFSSSNDNIRSFIKNKDDVDSSIKKTENTFSETLKNDNRYEPKYVIDPLNEEKAKDDTDETLIGKTRINFDAEEVFFANQKKSANTQPLQTYGDLMLQEKMELFKNNIRQKTSPNTTYTPPVENQLYSIPDNHISKSNDNNNLSIEHTYEPIQDAKQEYKIEKEYKNVLGKLFDEKNYNYEIKRAEHSIQNTGFVQQAEKTDNLSYDFDNIKVMPFSKETASEYYRTYYVFYNKFKLVQYLIFSLLILLVNIALFSVLNVVLKFDINTGYYFTGGLMSILIALMSSIMFFYKPNRRKKIYFDFKREVKNKFFLFLFLSALLTIVLYIFDNQLFMNFNHFSKALIGIILAVNVMSLPIIAYLMFKVRAFAVKV